MEPKLTSSGTLHCVVVTPERAVLDEAADFVALPMYDGELGVLPGRAPLIGRLGFGELRLVKGNVTRRYYIDGGFVQIRRNVITVLTSKAVLAEEIKPDVVLQALKTAQQPVQGTEAQEAQLKSQARARAQLRVSKKVHDEDEQMATH